MFSQKQKFLSSLLFNLPKTDLPPPNIFLDLNLRVDWGGLLLAYRQSEETDRFYEKLHLLVWIKPKYQEAQLDIVN